MKVKLSRLQLARDRNAFWALQAELYKSDKVAPGVVMMSYILLFLFVTIGIFNLIMAPRRRIL